MLPEALEGNKKQKGFPLPSGLDKTSSISDNHPTGSRSEQHFVLVIALVLVLSFRRSRNLLLCRLLLNAVMPTTENLITLYICIRIPPSKGARGM